MSSLEGAMLISRPYGDVDLWVASAGATGEAYLIPLSFYWDGAGLTIATPGRSRTGPFPTPGQETSSSR